MVLHASWASSSKVGSSLLGSFRHCGVVCDITSKEGYLLPASPTQCFLWSYLACLYQKITYQPFKVTLFWALRRWTCSTWKQWLLRRWDHWPVNSQKRTGLVVLKPPHDHLVHCSAIERPAQIKMGQWLREEKAKLWFPCGRRSTAPNFSMDKWWCCNMEMLKDWVQVFRWWFWGRWLDTWCFGNDEIIS